MSGGSLASKPTRSNTQGVFGRVGFFYARMCGTRVETLRTITMSKKPSDSTNDAQERLTDDGNPLVKRNTDVARQIAKAASDFEFARTGVLPKSVSVVLSDQTLVITLHGALSPAEQALATTPEGAVQVQEFHRQLFSNASHSLRQEIKRITGVDVRDATAEVEPVTGAIVGVFTTGTTVQVYLLANRVSPDTWEGVVPAEKKPD